MLLLKAEEYGIKNGEEISGKLKAIFKSAAETDAEKNLIFPKGTYYIDAESADKHTLYITNSARMSDWDKGEAPHKSAVGFYIAGTKNLHIDGGDSEFIIRGKATSVVITDSTNISIENLTFKYENPDMHELKVIKKTRFSVDFAVDAESRYEKIGNKFAFIGDGYVSPFLYRRNTAYWTNLIKDETSNTSIRVSHPFKGALKIKELERGVIRANYFNTARFNQGDNVYIFDAKRRNAGIFIDRSKGVTVKSVKQNFNYGLSFVAQDSENIVIDAVRFEPGENSKKLIASVADFIQICMCRGLVTVKNSRFVGAGDDCLNVHGVHFKVTRIKDNTVNVRFMHRETYGYNPLREGDKIDFVNPGNLIKKGGAVIMKSEMKNLRDIELTLDNASGLLTGDVIEDVDACPDLSFYNNFLSRIVTRGLLITTRGKVEVHDNEFDSTSMHSILISDDAKSWYESGRVENVTVENNVFGHCPEYTVCVKPENGLNKLPVHKNITVKNNVINSEKGGFYIRSAENVKIFGNKFTKTECRFDIKYSNGEFNDR